MYFLNLFIQKAYALQEIGVGIPGTTCTAGSEVELAQYIGCIYQFGVYIVIGLAILMVIWGGYKYITSQGNPDAINEAKDIIWGTIITLVILALSYLILANVGGGIV